MTPNEKLVANIINGKKIEADESFNYAVTQMALDKMAQFKQQTAQKIYGKTK
jgi:hypothetical protein